MIFTIHAEWEPDDYIPAHGTEVVVTVKEVDGGSFTYRGTVDRTAHIGDLRRIREGR